MSRIEGKIMGVVYRTSTNIEFTIVIEDDAIYEDGGQTMITLDWEQIALQQAIYINHLRDQNRIRPQEATPPRYNENEND